MENTEKGQAMVEYMLIATAIIVFIVGMQVLLKYTYQLFIVHQTMARFLYKAPERYAYLTQCDRVSTEAALDTIEAKVYNSLDGYRRSIAWQCPCGKWHFRGRDACPSCEGERPEMLAGAVITVTVSEYGGGERLHIHIIVPRGTLCQGLFNEIFALGANFSTIKIRDVPMVTCLE